MSKYLIEGETLTGIADAIRSKTGSTDPIVVSDMATQIGSITGGGSGGGSVEGVHYVTFMSEDGSTELYKRPVADGDNCADPVDRKYISEPTKASTAQYNYTHAGWSATPGGALDSDILKSITGDKTVYACFAAVLRHYTITYYDSDGTTVLNTESLAYGATPSYTPLKQGFYFDGWAPALDIVTGDTSYTATWSVYVVEASGTCPSGVTWELTSDGDFLAFGEGALGPYSKLSDIPWLQHAEKIKRVILNSGITETCSNAFSDCGNLVDVTLPDTFITFGSNSFYRCSGLSSIIIPASTRRILSNVFYGCIGLTSVTIPVGVIRIWRWAFSGCTNLKSVTFEDTANWYLGANDSTFTTLLNVTVPTTNATYLVTTYSDKFWSKKTS